MANVIVTSCADCPFFSQDGDACRSYCGAEFDHPYFYHNCGYSACASISVLPDGSPEWCPLRKKTIVVKRG